MNSIQFKKMSLKSSKEILRNFEINEKVGHGLFSDVFLAINEEGK